MQKISGDHSQPTKTHDSPAALQADFVAAFDHFRAERCRSAGPAALRLPEGGVEAREKQNHCSAILSFFCILLLGSYDLIIHCLIASVRQLIGDH